jgi:hypothetical protein
MTPLGFVLHIAGFVMPAFGVALVLWLGLRVRRAGRHSAAAQFGWLFAAGCAVLLVGLAYFGRDGKMATYAALVLAQGSVAWWLRGR